MVEATAENKQAAIEFVEKHGYAYGYTNIHDAYKSAFDIMDQYLKISDGNNKTSFIRLSVVYYLKQVFLENENFF